MPNVRKESRRLLTQARNLFNYGKPNPFPRTRRKAKPHVLRHRSDLEITSSLEFVASHVAKKFGEPFFVVQIGSFDGEVNDPITHLIRKYHWHGLLVEPQISAFKRLVNNYADQPQLRFENAAIDTKNGSRRMYVSTTGDTELASFDRNNMLRNAQSARDIAIHDAATITLSSLLKRHKVSRVDLLQIDAEGFDAQIIRSIDFEQFKPPIIRYEHYNLIERERSDCIRFLGNQGYQFLLEDIDTIAYCETASPQFIS